MIEIKKQEELFITIGRKLKRRIMCYVIGGSALMYYGIKQTTKDIDIVLLNENDRNDIVDVLYDLGYAERSTRILYRDKKNVPLLLQLGESRIDLFSQKIITFQFSKDMVDRVTKVFEYGNLIVKIVSLEDVILLKCATERAGDRSDVKAILEKTEVNWDYIIDESIKQTRVVKEIIPVYLYDFLLELKEDLKADIPKHVLIEVRKIAEKEMIKILKKKRIKS